jgi:hypothetical protein
LVFKKRFELRRNADLGITFCKEFKNVYDQGRGFFFEILTMNTDFHYLMLGHSNLIKIQIEAKQEN